VDLQIGVFDHEGFGVLGGVAGEEEAVGRKHDDGFIGAVDVDLVKLQTDAAHMENRRAHVGTTPSPPGCHR
jgi:hypothetical protein